MDLPPAKPRTGPEPPADYKVRTFAAEGGLPGLSKALVEEHLGLYKGYVTRTNALLKELAAPEKAALTTTAVQESRRRLGFEFSSMRLHELYFEALRGPGATPGATHPLQAAIAAAWVSTRPGGRRSRPPAP
jgi:Fe-Mn family superoxide dismutase